MMENSTNKAIHRVQALQQTSVLLIYDKDGNYYPVGKRHLAKPKAEMMELMEVAGYEQFQSLPENNRGINRIDLNDPNELIID